MPIGNPEPKNASKNSRAQPDTPPGPEKQCRSFNALHEHGAQVSVRVQGKTVKAARIMEAATVVPVPMVKLTGFGWVPLDRIVAAPAGSDAGTFDEDLAEALGEPV